MPKDKTNSETKEPKKVGIFLTFNHQVHIFTHIQCYKMTAITPLYVV